MNPFMSTDNVWIERMSNNVHTLARPGIPGLNISYGGFVAGAGTRVRLRWTGSTIAYKIWQVSGSEPASWTATGTDTAIPGAGRMAIHLNYGSTAQYVEWDDIVLTDDVGSTTSKSLIVSTLSSLILSKLAQRKKTLSLSTGSTVARTLGGMPRRITVASGSSPIINRRGLPRSISVSSTHVLFMIRGFPRFLSSSTSSVATVGLMRRYSRRFTVLSESLSFLNRKYPRLIQVFYSSVSSLDPSVGLTPGFFTPGGSTVQLEKLLGKPIEVISTSEKRVWRGMGRRIAVSTAYSTILSFLPIVTHPKFISVVSSSLPLVGRAALINIMVDSLSGQTSSLDWGPAYQVALELASSSAASLNLLRRKVLSVSQDSAVVVGKEANLQRTINVSKSSVVRLTKEMKKNIFTVRTDLVSFSARKLNQLLEQSIEVSSPSDLLVRKHVSKRFPLVSGSDISIQKVHPRDVLISQGHLVTLFVNGSVRILVDVASVPTPSLVRHIDKILLSQSATSITFLPQKVYRKVFLPLMKKVGI
jgi:hypothetical protein